MRSRRTLHRGTSGERVRRLQENLRRHGYDVGETDGHFGYVTEDALKNFQRDHRLRADGIVGPRTAYALDEAPTLHRVVHVVRKGDTLSHIARLYDVPLSALRWMNGMKPNVRLRPGRRIVLWRTYVLAGLTKSVGHHELERSLRPYARNISGLVVPSLECHPDGTITPLDADGDMGVLREWGWDCFVSVRSEDESLTAMMTRRRPWQRLLDQLRQMAANQPSFHLFFELEDIPLGGGARLHQACETLRRALPEATLVLSLPPLDRGWRGFTTGFDAGKVARYVDRIVLNLHRWEHLIGRAGKPVDFDTLHRWSARALRIIPPWKVWLGLPMDGCLMGSARTDTKERVTYRQAIGEGMRRGRRPIADETGFLFMEGEEGRRFVLQGRESLGRFLQLALRFRLSGLYIHPLGGEDRRLWDVLSHRVVALPPFHPKKTSRS